MKKKELFNNNKKEYEAEKACACDHRLDYVINRSYYFDYYNHYYVYATLRFFYLIFLLFLVIIALVNL